MIPERRHNLAGEPAHFCSGNELQDFFETGDGPHSSRLGALLEPFWIHVVGHFAPRRFVAQRPPGSIRFGHEQRDHRSVRAIRALA
jgi:hypothetical protein